MYLAGSIVPRKVSQARPGGAIDLVLRYFVIHYCIPLERVLMLLSSFDTQSGHELLTFLAELD